MFDVSKFHRSGDVVLIAGARKFKDSCATDDIEKMMLEHTSINLLGERENMANAALILWPPLASWISGHTLTPSSSGAQK